MITLCKEIISRLHARDVIAFMVLIFCFGLIGLGKNSYLYPITTLVIGYYFSKRVYEEDGRKSK